MALELLAIWAITIATIIWFLRDERRIAREKLEAAVTYYASAEAYRHRPAEPEPVAEIRPRIGGGLTAAQRRFFQELQRVTHDARAIQA